jgi:serine/threonine protein kinase
MMCTAALSRYGVLHGDIRSGNILISPVRSVLIDFGHAVLRELNATEEEWEEQVDRNDEVEALRRILNRRGLRDSSPVEPEPYYNPRRQGFFEFNERVEKYETEQWRRRWYNQVHLKPEVPEESVVKDGPIVPARWELKADVQEWLKSRPSPPECFTLSRPGSPDQKR